MSSVVDFIMERTVEEVQAIFGVTFKKHPHLLWEALNCPGSPCNGMNGHKLPEQGNKHLAFLGDVAASTNLSSSLYALGSSTRVMDDQRQRLLSNANFARRGRALGVQRYMHANPGQGSEASDGMIATTMEAIIGAAYKEGGMEMVAVVMNAMHLDRGWTPKSKKRASI